MAVDINPKIVENKKNVKSQTEPLCEERSASSTTFCTTTRHADHYARGSGQENKRCNADHQRHAASSELRRTGLEDRHEEGKTTHRKSALPSRNDGTSRDSTCFEQFVK